MKRLRVHVGVAEASRTDGEAITCGDGPVLGTLPDDVGDRCCLPKAQA